MFVAQILPSPGRWSQASRPRRVHAAALLIVYVGWCISLGRVIAPRIFPGENLMLATGHSFALVPVSYTVTLGLVLGLGLFHLGRTTPRAIGWHSSSAARDVAIGCAGFIAIAVILVAGIAVAGDSPREFVDEALSFTSRQRLLFVAIGFEGAVLEESLWRGYLQPSLMSRFGRPLGIVLTALLFAVAHFQFRPMQFVLKFAVGLVLGLLRKRDGSLVPPAVAHFLTWVFIGWA